MQHLADLQLLILIALANSSPVLAKRIFVENFAAPVDVGFKFTDGRPLFGASKTVRGIVASILVTAACAPLLGLQLRIGLLVALTAMAGDLLSSFLKRRLGLPSSSQAVGLDQIAESLFPLLACRQTLSLTAFDIAAVTALFFVGEVLLSRALFRFRVRDRPY